LIKLLSMKIPPQLQPLPRTGTNRHADVVQPLNDALHNQPVRLAAVDALLRMCRAAARRGQFEKAFKSEMPIQNGADSRTFPRRGLSRVHAGGGKEQLLYTTVGITGIEIAPARAGRLEICCRTFQGKMLRRALVDAMKVEPSSRLHSFMPLGAARRSAAQRGIKGRIASARCCVVWRPDALGE